MPNYFTDNLDLQFQFSRLNLTKSVSILEDDYEQAKFFDTAPTCYEEAMEFYQGALDLVGDLSGNYFEPRAKGIDAEGAKLIDGKVKYAQGTLESVQKLAESELMGVLLPRKFGGGNVPATIYTMMVEMLSQADASLMTLFGYQDVGEAIAKFGTQEQGELFLKKYCTGEHIGAMVLTEPHAGSDLQSAKLKAYQDEDGNWFLNGTKCFISNGCGDVLLILARSEPNTNNMFGLSMFACHGGDKIKVGRIEKKMGLHGSPTCELHFEDAPAQLIGKRRFGLIQVLHTLNHARFSVAAQALGIAEEAYKEALSWAKDRIAFGVAIIEKPAVANMLIDMRVRIESSRTLLYNTVPNLDLRNKLEEKIEHIKKDKNKDKEAKKELLKGLNVEFALANKLLEMQSPLVKYQVTEMANKVCFDALQIHGGAGYTKEGKIERLCRDVRITNIYEGTSQVQIIGATKGVKQDILSDYFDSVLEGSFDKKNDSSIKSIIELRNIYNLFISKLNERDRDKENDKVNENEVLAKDLVDLYAAIHVSCLILEETKTEVRKINILARYVKSALAKARKGYENLMIGTFDDLDKKDIICQVY
ncbi:MAG: alkylation response protein AidB-like acyl-CoA dehydrogenase [Polaribacter sp.]|jgi:alkylation response protein AidB-like acyl-CoA dehydrogenase